MKKFLHACGTVIFIALFLACLCSIVGVWTVAAAPAETQATCPDGGDWVKVDGLSGYTYTYTPPVGYKVTENCYKHSTYVHYGTGPTVSADSHLVCQQWWNCQWKRYELSHASFKLAALPTSTPTPTPTNIPVTPTSTPTSTPEEPTSTPTPTPEDPTPTPITPTPTKPPKVCRPYNVGTWYECNVAGNSTYTATSANKCWCQGLTGRVHYHTTYDCGKTYVEEGNWDDAPDWLSQYKAPACYIGGC